MDKVKACFIFYNFRVLIGWTHMYVGGTQLCAAPDESYRYIMYYNLAGGGAEPVEFMAVALGLEKW